MHPAARRDAAASPCTVTTLAAAGAGSLSELVADAACPTISFDPSILPGQIDQGGTLAITRSVTINGPGSAKLALSANHEGSVVVVRNGTVNITGLTIRDGAGSDHFAGGIDVFPPASLSLGDVVLANNEGVLGPGGLMSHPGTSVTISGSTIRDNTGDHGAGGLWLEGDADIERSVIAFNHVGFDETPGGLLATGTVTLQNVTISGNDGRAAVSVAGGVSHFSYVTVTSNAGEGVSVGDAATLNLEESIVAGNAGTDCLVAGSPLGHQQFSVIGGTGCGLPDAGGNRIGVDPKLGPLADNGGNTLTHVPQPGSPAIDIMPAGELEGCGASRDQRGFGRPHGDACDAGAAEIPGTFQTMTTVTAVPASSTGVGATVTFTATVSLPDGSGSNTIFGGTMTIVADGSCAAPGATLGSAAIAAAPVSVTTQTLAAGHHTILACYTGPDLSRSASAALFPAASSGTMGYDIIADGTPPVITPTLTGTLGTNGWYTSDVSVAWNVSDAESAITSRTGCGASSVTADTPGQIISCTATSAGGTGSSSVTIKRDASPPVIAFDGPTSYTVDQDIAIVCTASDATSGIATQACPSATGPAFAAGVGSHTLQAAATNNAGLPATAAVTYTVTVTPAGVTALVARLVTESGIANSLIAKLQHGQYQAFVAEVRAQSGKKIPANVAAMLIELAGRL